jgi:hypothetical protein
MCLKDELTVLYVNNPCLVNYSYMFMLNNVNVLNTDLFLSVGGSIGMRISLVKKKLPFYVYYKRTIVKVQNRIDF